MVAAAAPQPATLFHPERHEALAGPPWDEQRAREGIASIVRDTWQARLPDGSWPVHPQDDEGDTPAGGFRNLYLGSAGVLWALWWLQREGFGGGADVDIAAALREADEACAADAADAGSVVPSYFLGQVGILLARWCVAPDDGVADRLHDAVRSNIPNPTNEALWAAPGTMVAAWHLWEATGQARWRELFLDNVEQLWRTWQFDEGAGCHLWTQDLYGRLVQYLGAGHGFAGNVYPLLKGAALLDAPRRQALLERCVATLGAFAQCGVDAGRACVNWPVSRTPPRPGRPAVLMQWCHGAPGIVTALADFPVGVSETMDAWLVGAGEAIWSAGPLVKGHGLCHGTAGNGCAFLTLYRRTGDPTWLQRARAFAMHALAQGEQARAQHGRGRYTLWTGDLGLATCLAQCIDGRAGMAGLDLLR